MKITEKVLIYASLLLIILSLFEIPYSPQALVISILLLSLLYLFFGFALFNGIRLREVFKSASYKNTSTLKMLGAIGMGLALFIALNGILFQLMVWPGFIFMISFAFSTVIVIAAIVLYKYYKIKSEYYRFIITRLALWGGLVIVLRFIPVVTWVEFKLRNHPEYLEAYKEWARNPNSEAAFRKLEEARAESGFNQ